MSPEQQQPAPPSPLGQRLKPRPVTRLNRKVIIAVLGILALMIAVALRQSRPPTHPQGGLPEDGDTIHTQYRQKPSGMLALPSSYGDLQHNGQQQLSRRPAVQPMVATQVAPQPMARSQNGNRGQNDAAQELKSARQSDLLIELRKADGGPIAPQTEVRERVQRSPLGIAQEKEKRQDRGLFDQNRQDDKRAFLREAGEDRHIYLHQRIQEPRSPYTVHAGSIIPAALKVGVNSDLPGQITALVRETVYDSVTGKYPLIPQGTTLIGVYDSTIVFGQRRVLMAWVRLIFPNGDSISLEGMPGVDLAGLAGVKDTVNNHFGAIFGSVILSTFLSVGSRIPAGQISRDQGTNPGEEFAQRAAENFNSVGQQIIERNLHRQATLELRPGLSLNVMVHRDMILRPYND